MLLVVLTSYVPLKGTHTHTHTPVYTLKIFMYLHEPSNLSVTARKYTSNQTLVI